jgi:hypothetical protein
MESAAPAPFTASQSAIKPSSARTDQMEPGILPCLALKAFMNAFASRWSLHTLNTGGGYNFIELHCFLLPYGFRLSPE